MKLFTASIRSIRGKTYRENYTIQLWGQSSCAPSPIGRIRQYGITQTQNLSRSNSAIRIFVDLTRSIDTSALFTCRQRNDNLIAFRLRTCDNTKWASRRRSASSLKSSVPSHCETVDCEYSFIHSSYSWLTDFLQKTSSSRKRQEKGRQCCPRNVSFPSVRDKNRIC